jgi:hypothetical protein
VIIGSAPVRRTPNGASIGGQTVSISLTETVIAQTQPKPGPDRYYDTASRYFVELNRAPTVVALPS